MRILPSAVLFLFCIGIMGCQIIQSPPNVLFIVVDDLGYNDLSCMGSQYYETPNIDLIAQNGTIFRQGYATCAVCSPSRASLLTGKFAARHGITDYIGAPSGTGWRKHKRYTKLLPAVYRPHLQHEYQTWPEVLQENGYKTFFAGKWHLGGEGSHPEDHGFDINQGGFHQGGPYTGGYFSPFNNPKMTDYPDEKGMSLSMKLAKETNQFIEQHQDKPFLAYLAFYAVHSPIQTTETKWNKYRQKAEDMGIQESGFEMERRLPIRKHQDNPVYAGLIEQVDDAVGAVLANLKKLGLDERTIIIFTSDNGGVSSGDNYSTNLSPLRGGKGYQWEGGIRVPFFISVPWMEQTAFNQGTPVSGADFYPTILELLRLDLKPTEHVDGISLMPLLMDENLPERDLFWHYPHYGNQGGDPHAMIRNGDWKLIHYWESGVNELYQMSADIGEQHNVSSQYPEITQAMHKRLRDWLISVKAKYPLIDPLFSPDSLALKQEGYRTLLKERLEQQRKEMLEPDWQPNEDWWGSDRGK